MQLSKRLDLFGDEVFALLNAKRRELEAQGRRMYDLSVGTPDFQPPQHVVDAFIESARKPESWKYSLHDTPEMLDALCAYYEKRYGVSSITPDMAMSCRGTQEGMAYACAALVDPGDIALIPDPCYPVFQAGTLIAGATPWYYPLTAEHNFLPYVAGIPDDVADRAKYMVVSLPANPVGSVGSFLAYEGALDVGVEFFSLSKSFNVTGVRMSFLVGRPDVVGGARKLRSQVDFGMPYPEQAAAIACLTGPLDQVERQRMQYQERRDAICDGLEALGWERPNAHGSMFVWARIPGEHADSKAFALELMERSGVIVTPGASFGPSGEGYVRIALVLPPDGLREAVAAIGAAGIV